MEPVYRYYSWKSLLKSCTKGVAVTEYGRKLMHEIMMNYDGDHDRYAKISGHGFRIRAETMEDNLTYEVTIQNRLKILRIFRCFGFIQYIYL